MRYVITGGSGYIGSRLVEFLIGREDTERVVIADVRPPRHPRGKTEFHRTDVRDRLGLQALLERERPDAFVHLAFMLNPIHDEAAMYDIDVNGTVNALEAAAHAGVGQVLVTSSTTAYGAWPDNPEPIDEDWVLRGQPNFAYARHKTECDRLCQLWAAQHPDRVMTIVRPCIVLGPTVENYLVRGWDQPFLVRFRGERDIPVQFIHEDDLAEAVSRLLVERHAGAFNVTGDGTTTVPETAEMIGREVHTVPFRLIHAYYGLAWRLHMPGVESPPGNLDFLRYPWVCSNEKLKRTLGWTPRYTTLEAFQAAMRARGLLGPDPAGGPAADGAASEDGRPAQDTATVA